MSERAFSAGDVLAEKYQLVALLGQGGMGEVWRADHLALRSVVAVKLIHRAAAQSEDLLARFLREAQAAAALRSPHVVQTLDFGVHEGTPFMVMELLDGESLRERLSRVGCLPPAEVSRVVVQVARALTRAHELGIVHRDLKPDNVFLVRNLDEELAKVLDFGIAKSLGDPQGVATATRTGAILGTPHYMSPEQARGTRAVDHRTDLWALGVIAFECLLGRRPFDSTTLADLLLKICSEPAPVPSCLAALPPGFDAWFGRAVERDPSRRFQSALEMAEALRVALGATPSLVPPSNVGPTAVVGPVASAEAVAHLPLPPVLDTAPQLGVSGTIERKPASVPLVGWGLALAGLGALLLLGAAGLFLALRRGPVVTPAPSSAAATRHLEDAGPDDGTGADGAAAAGRDAEPGVAAGVDGGGWNGEVQSAQAEAKDARAKAKKAREEAAKARAAAAEARRKVLQGLP